MSDFEQLRRAAMDDPRNPARDAVPEFDARVVRLWKHRMAGPDYRRRVVEEVAAALRAWEPEHVGARLVTAEIAAGLRPEADYLDRFNPDVWKIVPQ